MPPRPTPPLRAAFSEAGVAWVVNGQACVARAPAFQAVCPRLGRIVDVAWNGGDAWAAAPDLGLVITLDRAAQTLAAGAVVALSGNAIYRQDGSSLNYLGSPSGGVAGKPSLAVTGGDGLDYVLLAGQLVRVSDNVVLDRQAPAYIALTPNGVQAASAPSVVTSSGTYRLANGRLERLDGTGKVLASVPHPFGLVGMVGNEVVTVSEDGVLRRFRLDLQE